MYIVVTILMILFIILGTFDGLYFHLYKYRLHLLPAARREHIIHTARAFVFVPLAILLFVINSSGLLLWAAILLIVLDTYLELIDILEERKSRASFGGISSEESAIHVFASSLKFAAIILILTTKSAESYLSMNPLILEAALPPYLTWVGVAFAAGSFGGGLLSMFPNFKISVCCRICPEPIKGDKVNSR